MRTFADATAWPGDINDTPNLQGDVIIHAAAMTNVNACEQDRDACYRSNVEGTRNMCRLAMHTQARLVYISTVSVFSGNEGDYTDTSLPYPQNYYSLSKYLGEALVAQVPGSIIVRCNVIGIHPDGSRGRNFVEWLHDSFTQHRDITLFTDARINPLSNYTIAEQVKMAVNTTQRVLHLGASNVRSKAQIGALVRQRFADYQGTAKEAAQSGGATRGKELWLRPRADLPSVEDEIARIFSEHSQRSSSQRP